MQSKSLLNAKPTIKQRTSLNFLSTKYIPSRHLEEEVFGSSEVLTLQQEMCFRPYSRMPVWWSWTIMASSLNAPLLSTGHEWDQPKKWNARVFTDSVA